MQFKKWMAQNDFNEVIDLFKSCSDCLLITISKTGDILTGVFNPLYYNGKLVLHLNRADEQVKALKNKAQATIVFKDCFAMIPSNWVDAHNAGMATSYYRYAEVKATVEIIDTIEDQIKFLSAMMKHFQPQGHYTPLESDLAIYKQQLQTILITNFTIVSTKTKWKLGQNKPQNIRKQVAQKLKERALPNDLLCAIQVEKWQI